MKPVYKHRLGAGLIASVLLVTSGCGYFLHPERVGRTEGRVDPAVVVLDAASLLFGIIPGVVAFAVDLTTGTIYLPPGEENVLEKHKDRLSSFNTPMSPLDPQTVDIDRQTLAERLSVLLDQPVSADQIRYYRSFEGLRIAARKVNLPEEKLLAARP